MTKRGRKVIEDRRSSAKRMYQCRRQSQLNGGDHSQLRLGLRIGQLCGSLVPRQRSRPLGGEELPPRKIRLFLAGGQYEVKHVVHVWRLIWIDSTCESRIMYKRVEKWQENRRRKHLDRLGI